MQSIVDKLMGQLYSATLMIEQFTMPPKIIKLATLIRDYEGKIGDRNYRNNNAGNCRFHHGGYLPKYGKVTEDKDGFAIFPTWQQGWLYLQNMLLAWARGSRANWSIVELMASYAPNSDGNDPVAYAKYLTEHLGVDAKTQLKDLLK